MKATKLNKHGAHQVSKGILLSGFLLLVSLTPQISAHASTSLTQTFTISGRVTDGFGNAIRNATVTLSGTQAGTTTTDVAGGYSFANLQAGGNYILAPSKAGEYTAFNGVANNLSSDVTVNLRLEPQVRFSIRVADPSGNRLAAASIRVDDGRVASAQTNSMGIANVSVGVEAVGDTPIKLFAEKPGFIFNPPSLTFHSRDGNQVVNITATPTGLPISFIQFSVPGYTVGEGDGSVNITVTRSGDTSGAVSVSYSTSDTATATQKSDYTLAAGTLSFAAGETSKNFQVLIVDNAYPQGNHVFSLQLTNPTGGASLGDSRSAGVTIIDNDTNPPTTNPLDNPPFFVRQHYYDFLNRQPDASGGAFWTNEITSCGSDQQCIDVKRMNVSAAFFLSIEFEQTGYLVERIYKTSYGDATGTSTLGGAHQLSVPVIRFNELLSDTQEIGQGVVVGQANWPQKLEDSKQAFTTEFVQRSRFTSAFPTSMTPAEFVDKLNGNAGSPLSQSERDQLASDLSTKVKTRAQVLRAVAEDPRLFEAEFNRAFVLMEYIAYLRRNPNGPPDTDYTGYDFWLTKLNQFKGNFVNAEMVKAFINSVEYRQRFGPRVDTTPPIISFKVTPAPNAAGWNKSNPTVTFTCDDSGSGIAFCTEPVTITTETASQIVEGIAVDNTGNSAAVSVTVKLDKTSPILTVTSPAEGSKIFFSPVAVGGTVEDPLSGLTGVTCNGAPATVNGTSFNCGVTLTPGANSLDISAIDVAGNTSKSNLGLAYARPPTVTIAAPSNLSYLNISPTTVTGTVDDPTATVTVNSVPAAVVNGSFSVALPLAEGPNTITATATSAAGTVGTATIQATLDTTPPHVTITSPPDQFVTTDASISVAGNVNDIVVGTVNAEQAQVNVNGSAAQVANRAFLAMNVPLAVGPNVIQAVGRDRVGNAATTEITVMRQAPGQPRIRLISGNNQTGIIGALLAAPLVVSVVDANNNPLPNKPVIFKVTQDNGMVSAGGPSAATVIATTDAQGQAQAQWKLGMRSGAGANTVEAYSVGFEGTAIFIATGTQGPAGKIVIDTGNDQTGAANQPLPKPLIAVVVDDGNNRLAGVPVTFTVKEGGGNFGGQPSFTVNTDSDGRVAATLTLGLQEGNANNLVEATFPSNTSFAASFTASGRAPTDPSKTAISGLVLDNSNVPIPGVTIRAVLTNMLNANSSIVQTLAGIQTDEQGQFVIPQAPVGFVKLLVDGSTAQRPGTYPTLDYDLVTIAGQDNKLSMPIFLLPLNFDNKLCVTATTGGGTLTIPEAPGFSLTFGPGQVTFPGGSKTGCVSVTVVHGDKVPMVPGFGQQPRFIVTIQPSGAVFNLPAAITLPNVDGLKPREVTEMYSFDHDIGSFVAIGTGTVSDDGQVIRSNPGVGVLKAGWHCGGNPAANGTAADCGDCKICQGNNCVADRAKEGIVCDDRDNKTVEDKCSGGTCAGKQISLEFQQIWSDQFAGIKANFLPGGAGVTGSSKKYILMGARSDAKGYFQGTLKITPDTAEARSRVRVAVEKDGVIESQGSLSGSIASGSAAFEFGQVTDFQLVAGVDKNKNGRLDIEEISASHEALGVFRVVPKSVYEFNRAGAVAGTILPGLPFALPNATLFLFCFATGRVPVDATVTNQEVRTSNPSLSHAVGALWGNDLRAQIPRFEFGPVSSTADDVEVSTPFQDSLQITLATNAREVRTFFKEPANASVPRQVFGPWNVKGNSDTDTNINFAGDFDLFLAIGTGSITGQVRVEVARQGGDLVVTAIEAVNVTIYDLYDWDYDNGFNTDRRAATVQAGYDTLGNGGRIFWSYIVVNGNLTTIPAHKY